MILNSIVTKILDANGDGELSNEELSLAAFLSTEGLEEKKDAKKAENEKTEDAEK